MSPGTFEEHLSAHGSGLAAWLPLVLHAGLVVILIAALLHLASAALLRRRGGCRHPDELFAALNVPTAVAGALGILTVVLICCHHQVVARELETRSWHFLLSLTAWGLLLFAATRTALFAARSRRVERSILAAAAQPGPRLRALAERMGLAFPVLELDGPLPSMSFGRLRPRIVISSRLVSTASDGELEAVLWHEAAHARNRDNLRRLACVFSTSMLCWLPTAPWMHRRWRESCELWCDDAAVGRTRRPLDLAAALIHEARLRSAEPPPSVSPAAGEGGVRGRVRRLLGDWAPLPGSALVGLGAVLLLTTVVTFSVMREEQWIFSLWCLTGGAAASH